MINPDGVIHGNYRCSIVGNDLNRKWKNPDKNKFPEIYYLKQYIL
jgi:murein tripeptide amidase MpaA